LDESNDTSDTAQLLIVIQGLTKSFQVIKEVVLKLCMAQEEGCDTMKELNYLDKTKGGYERRGSKYDWKDDIFGRKN
jgi:hypothetical protein